MDQIDFFRSNLTFGSNGIFESYIILDQIEFLNFTFFLDYLNFEPNIFFGVKLTFWV